MIAAPERRTEGQHAQASAANGDVRAFRQHRNDCHRRRAGQDHRWARQGLDQHRWKDPRVQGHSVRGATGRGVPLEGTTARQRVGRRSRRDRVRCPVRARPDLRRHHVSATCERRLPQPEHLDTGDPGERSAAGDGLDPWRRLPGRCGSGAAARRRCARAQGCRAGHDQLPAGRLRILCAPGADARVGPQCVWQLRLARSDRGAPLGARQHRRVRWQPLERDDLRRIGRLVRSERADGCSARGRPLSQSNRRERCVLHGGQRNARASAVVGERATGRQVWRRDGGRDTRRASRDIRRRAAQGRAQDPAVVLAESRRLCSPS